MKAVLQGEEVYPYLDPVAQNLLGEARQSFADLKLSHQSFIESGGRTCLFTWQGDWANDALAVLLEYVGLPTENSGLVIEVQGGRALLESKLREVAALKELKASTVLHNVQNMIREKWDWALPSELLMESFATMYLDLEKAQQTAAHLIGLETPAFLS
ncbi:hypothetical protein OLN00_30455 [Pseudomonas aeruginosa]|nr:hypothetical protein [Pseudomonas aeruginosa]MDI2561712.1 hypothetical protein [Pseudomonas aeruginosa]